MATLRLGQARLARRRHKGAKEGRERRDGEELLFLQQSFAQRLGAPKAQLAIDKLAAPRSSEKPLQAVGDSVRSRAPRAPIGGLLFRVQSPEERLDCGGAAVAQRLLASANRIRVIRAA